VLVCLLLTTLKEIFSMSTHRLRIAIGGIGHETNTFSSVWTEYEDFNFARGDEILKGRLGQAGYDGADLLPAFVATALPGGVVTAGTYARLKRELLDELELVLPLDGVCLDLHGAMHVEGLGSVEGDLVSTVRAQVGDEALISASLDLHGNVSPLLVDKANILTALRTAPHRDGVETRQRALGLLVQALREHQRPVSVLVKPPLLLAGESAMTDVEPAKSLYARLPEIARTHGLLDASLLIGCAWTDGPYTSASVIVVAKEDRALAHRQAAALAREVWERRRDFRLGMETLDTDEAIRRAMAAPEQPVFISDSGDNVTAGAPGDLPLVLEQLLALGAPDALVAGLVDRASVERCVEASAGAQVALRIGGKLDTTNARPFPVTVQVERLAADPQGQSREPAMAVVRVAGVRVILTAGRRFFTQLEHFAAAGLDPQQQKLVVVKQGYLFPELADIAPMAFMALTPGATDLRLERLPYRHLPRPIFPLEGDFAWAPE
jgi:microcystin degradation protein MlrC